MSTNPAIYDPLHAHLSGKRAAKRHPVRVEASIRDGGWHLPCHTVDVSRSGCLLDVSLADLATQTGRDPDTLGFQEIHGAFRGRMKLRFAVRVTARAVAVRLAVDPDNPDRLQVGCRFRRALRRRELERFGIDPEDCAADGAVRMDFDTPVCAEDVTAWVHRLDDRESPAFGAVLTALNEQHVLLWIPDAKRDDVLLELGRSECFFRLTSQFGVIWESEGSLRGLPRRRRGAPGVELAVVADADLAVPIEFPTAGAA